MDSTLLVMLAVVICIFAVWQAAEIVCNRRWHKQKRGNFPFIYKGRVFWYSRSVFVSVFVFAKDENDKWNVLATERYNGAHHEGVTWNVPCGYLDFDESGEQCSRRIAYEDTSVKVPVKKLSLFSVETSPKNDKKQRVALRYCAVLDTKTTDNETNTDDGDPEEVLEALWLPIKNLDDYQWSSRHKSMINKAFEFLKLKK